MGPLLVKGVRLGVLGPQTQQEAYLLAVRFTDLRQRWALPLQRLIANCVQVHVGEKGKNGAHAFAAVVHLHVCSGRGRCCGAGTQLLGVYIYIYVHRMMVLYIYIYVHHVHRMMVLCVYIYVLN